MKEIKNIQELIKLIDLYKAGKVTKYSLESELTQAIEGMTLPIRTAVKILGASEDSTSTPFGIATLPNISSRRTTATIYIDDSLILSCLSEEEVIKLLVIESLNLQSILRVYSRFTAANISTDISVEDTLVLFIDIMNVSLGAIKNKAEDIFEKMKESNLVVCIKDLQKQKEKLGIEKLSEIIESLIISCHFPSVYIDASKKLATAMRRVFKGAAADLAYSDETPNIDLHDSYIKDLTDGSYKNLSKKIDYNYKPDTN